MTGLGLADFLTGQASGLTHGTPTVVTNHQLYTGVYVQDAWRATDRITLNLGLRWEPYFGTASDNGAVTNFSIDNFNNVVRSTVFVNAPVGLLFPGDAGFPEGNTGMNKQWRNFSPRLGLAWDPTGNGQLALRSSYAINYDFPTAIFQQIPASAAPFGNRLTLTGNLPFEDPYRNIPGGSTLPAPVPPPSTVQFPGAGSYVGIDPDINSTRVQSWNVTVERQIGAAWRLRRATSAPTSIGCGARKRSTLDLHGHRAVHAARRDVSGLFGRLEHRRAPRLLADQRRGGAEAVVRLPYRAIGIQDYAGLKLSFQNRGLAASR